MKNLKRTVAMLLCIAMTVAMLVSCSLEEKENGGVTPTPGAVASQFSETELTTAVITVGDHVVTLAEYIDFFDEVCTYYSDYYGYDVKSDTETLASYKDMMTKALAQDQMILHQADILELSTLTAEQEAEIAANYQKEVDDLYEYYTEYAQKEADEDEEIDIDERVEEYILDEAEYYLGSGATVEEYMKYLEDEEREKFIFALVKEHYTAEVKVTDEDVQEWYDSAVEDDETYYKENPGEYKIEREEYDRTGTVSDGTTAVPPVYIPSGYSRILTIHIASEDEPSEDYTKNETKMKELMTEYGELSFNDDLNGTSKNKERLAEILKEYKKLQKANEDELDELYADAKKKAEEAYAKLEDGSEFVDVLTEYTDKEDVLMTNENVRNLGLLISKKHVSETDWSDTVKTEFAKLSVGEYSKVFRDSDGYYILYYLGNEKSGVTEFEEVKTIIHDYLLPTQQDEAYDSVLEDLMKDEDKIIVYNEELIAKVK